MAIKWRYVNIFLLLTSFIPRKRKEFSGFKNIVEVKHHTNGRIRLFVPVLKNNERIKQHLDSHLAKIESFTEYNLNTITGSVLLKYNESELPLVMIVGIIIKLLGLEQKLLEPPTGLLKNKFKDGRTILSRSVYEKSNGVLDINSATSLAMLGTGIYAMVQNGFMLPNSATLLYWAYNEMRRK